MYCPHHLYTKSVWLGLSLEFLAFALTLFHCPFCNCSVSRLMPRSLAALLFRFLFTLSLHALLCNDEASGPSATLSGLDTASVFAGLLALPLLRLGLLEKLPG